MKFWRFRKNKENPVPVDLLIKQFYDLVSGIQEKSANSREEHLNRFYDADGVPVTRRIKTADNSYVDIPLISLVNNRPVLLSEFTVEFYANVDAVNQGDLKKKAREITKKGITLDFSKKTDEKNKLSIKLSYNLNT